MGNGIYSIYIYDDEIQCALEGRERQGQGKIPRESNVHAETKRWVKVRQKGDKYGLGENNISNLELRANMTIWGNASSIWQWVQK